MTSLLYYSFVPLLTGLVFLGGLITLLAAWTAEGHPKYLIGEPSIEYISNIGAHLKPFFITICSITAPGFVLSQAIDFFLRRQHRLAPNITKTGKRMSWLALFCSMLGGILLILLSIFDAFNHFTIHWSLTTGFVACLGLGAIFQTIQFAHLKAEHKYFSLRLSFILKFIIVFIAIGAAASMGLLFVKGLNSPAAACEWVVAFVFVFYIFLMMYDIGFSNWTPPSKLGTDSVSQLSLNSSNDESKSG